MCIFVVGSAVVVVGIFVVVSAVVVIISGSKHFIQVASESLTGMNAIFADGTVSIETAEVIRNVKLYSFSRPPLKSLKI